MERFLPTFFMYDILAFDLNQLISMIIVKKKEVIFDTYAKLSKDGCFRV